MTDSKNIISSEVISSPVERTSDDNNNNNNNDDDHNLHFFRRGTLINEDAHVDDSQNITGYDSHRMRARASLTAEEEKRLLRRIDWRLMPLCSLMFLIKNIDANSVCYFSFFPVMSSI